MLLLLLDEYCDEIFQGLISGGDKLLFFRFEKEDNSYLHGLSLYDGNSYKIEKTVAHKVLKGSEVKRYTVPDAEFFLIYPYESVAKKTVLIQESKLKTNFPHCYAYLKSIKKELQSRGSENMEYLAWYSLWNPRNYKKFATPKIVTQVLSHSPNYGIDLEGEYFFVGGGNAGAYGIIPKDLSNLHFLLACLNSEVHFYFIKNNSSQFRGGYYSYAKRFIENFPIKTSINAHKFLSCISRYILFLSNKNLNLLYSFFVSLSDSIVYELYFKDEVTKSGKEIMKHIGDLKEIDKNMKEEKQLSIIQSEFDRLYDPNHPVRSNVETIDSIDEIRIIKQALN